MVFGKKSSAEMFETARTRRVCLIKRQRGLGKQYVSALSHRTIRGIGRCDSELVEAPSGRLSQRNANAPNEPLQ